MRGCGLTVGPLHAAQIPLGVAKFRSLPSNMLHLRFQELMISGFQSYEFLERCVDLAPDGRSVGTFAPEPF